MSNKVIIGVDYGSYSFDASAKQVTLSGITTVSIEQFLLIVNTVNNQIIYSPVKSGYGGTVAGSVITLEYDTTSMSDTDELQVYFALDNSTDIHKVQVYDDNLSKIRSTHVPDTGNTTIRTSVHGASQFIGTAFDCRNPEILIERIIASQQLIFNSNVTSGLGGTFVFEYSDDNFVTTTVSETRTIDDFSTVRDLTLQCVGDFFRVKFTPSRALVGGEEIYIVVNQWYITPPSFVRLATQEIEEQNAAFGSHFSYLKGFNARTGKSINFRGDEDESLIVRNTGTYITPSGSNFSESIRDDISHNFSASKVTDEITKLMDLGSSGSFSLTADTTNGVAVFSTGSTLGSRCVYGSEKKAVYEPGHGIRGEQTTIINQIPTTGYIEWGYSSDDLQNKTGYGVDATGVYTFRKVLGSYQNKVYQIDWNRDKCNGIAPSLFKKNTQPIVLNILKDNLTIIEYEWLGAAPHVYKIKTPTNSILEVNVDEYPNDEDLPSLPDPQLRLHIEVYNGTTAENLIVKTGSWRGGLFTSKFTPRAKNPDGDFEDAIIGGLDSGNTSDVNLIASGVFTGIGHVSAGKYKSIGTYLYTTENCTIEFQTSKTKTGTYRTVTTRNYVANTPQVFYFVPAGNFYRLKVTNLGVISTTEFDLQAFLYENAIGQILSRLDNPLVDASLGQQVRAVITAKTPDGSYVNIPSNELGAIKVDITSDTPTYSAAAIGITTVITPTDVFTITGSATKVIRINKLFISGTKGTNGTADLIILKRSTPNTGGTTTTVTAVPRDSLNAAATAVVRYYTVNPLVLGTLVGNIDVQKVFISNGGSIGDRAIFEYSIRSSQPIVLRGVNEMIAFNLAGLTLAGSSLDISVEWTESNY